MARSQPVNSNWCWAACLEMIFARHGFVVGMQRIVSEAYGRQGNFGANSRTLAALLSRNWLDDGGRPFATNCDVLWDAASGSRIEHGAALAALRLAEGEALLIGTRSHAMVTLFGCLAGFHHPTACDIGGRFALQRGYAVRSFGVDSAQFAGEP